MPRPKWNQPSAPAMEEPSVEQMDQAVDELRSNFLECCTTKKNDPGRWDLAWRKKNLRALYDLIVENSDEILEAGRKDMGKGASEWFLEKQAMLGDLRLIMKKLSKWMRAEKRGTPLWMAPSSSYVKYEPYGVTIVLGAWNYPFTLTLLPVAAALAAGNACLIKPPELAPAQSNLMGKLFPQYLDPSACRVILGGAVTAAALVERNVDFVFFTGSTKTGTLVSESCARRLIPCALELGGKSPTIVDETCDLPVACRRICQAKFVNAGQTCVANDYLLIVGDEERKKEVMAALDKELINQFGTDAQKSSEYARIINEGHVARLQSIMKGETVFRGGKTDPADKYIEPTILSVDISNDTKLMTDEIFGPILPCISVPDIDTAIQYIRARPKPLALYIFSSNKKNVERVLSRTTAGSACVNESVFQYLNPFLPFGGVGASGSGSYHGHASFLEFSHAKSILARGTKTDIKLRYLPYISKPWVQKLFDRLMSM